MRIELHLTSSRASRSNEMNRVIIVTGGDSNFYPFILSALSSLERSGVKERVDVGVIDQGLSAEQREKLISWGARLQVPEWTIDVPPSLRTDCHLGLVARTALRDYFPGYNTYLWFDADAWVQTDEFLESFVAGARHSGIAVTPENGAGYKRSFRDSKWWYGNFFAGYGPWDAARLSLRAGINIGVIAIQDTAPHWEAWVSHYTRLIRKTDKLNMDQHALVGAVRLEGLPVSFVDARCNWICTMSTPEWDPDRRLMCEPGRRRRPLSVLHLAGPDKTRIYTVPCHGQVDLQTPLTLDAVCHL